MKINSVTDTEAIRSNTYNKERLENGEQEKQNQKGSKSINASQLNLCQDEIAEKKQKAMQEAMDFIKKQFESDGKIDETLDECRENIAENKEKAQEASKELKAVQEEKEHLKEVCPDEDSEEYKANLKELNERAGYWKGELDAASSGISDSTKAIKSIKQEALKHHGMVDATKAAEESLKAASKEIIGMLMDEAKDKVDQDLEEVVEKAEEVKEEKEEKEEALEEAQAEREKQAAEIEEERKKNQQSGRSSVRSVTAIDVKEIMDKQREIVQNTQQILEEQKLLTEEIKGIVVDFNL